MWAISILDHSKNYVSFLDEKNPCPLPIYDLCFVPTAMALVDPKGSKEATSFIIENHITGTWQKFIGNANAIPLMASGEEGYEHAQYMSFLQHIQFEKTRRLAYISDWQGNSDTTFLYLPRLTCDNRPALYGDGNVASAFLKFPEEHCCNRYCSWAGLKPPSHDNIDNLTNMSTGE
ncbi:hypothetical protein F5890DRAFT_1420575 [Lentinula detonsa]|uniref:Alpha-type protein kinase domain-containing protein n=1 Tax=Lentinula detonsa TaxID=2804962 RepID=A0AA38PRF5_9AGAR|nr:hypothetical protein F5890DRAFT_1420575 [Lentinula detonsa]